MKIGTSRLCFDPIPIPQGIVVVASIRSSIVHPCVALTRVRTVEVGGVSSYVILNAFRCTMLVGGTFFPAYENGE